jgi:hypothetical protein
MAETKVVEAKVAAATKAAAAVLAQRHRMGRAQLQIAQVPEEGTIPRHRSDRRRTILS